MLWQNIHPFPNRCILHIADLMQLSTIRADDAPSKKKLFKIRENFSLRTDDIAGAQPALKGYQYSNKPDFSNTTHDIEKARPKIMHRQLNKSGLSLTTSDIEKAASCQNSFTTNRETNPLNPQYILPGFEVKPSTPPKFIRDSIQVDDIQGAKSKTACRPITINSNSVNELEGARLKPERCLVKPDSMNTSDINIKKFRTNRRSNPLEPKYTIRNSDGKLEIIGNIEGSRAKSAIRSTETCHKRNIDCSDIEGAQTSTVGLGPFISKQRSHKKNPIDASDILGTTSGSHKIGIKTNRVINPLDPHYKWATKITDDSNPLKKLAENPPNSEMIQNSYRFFGISTFQDHTSRPQTSKQTSDPGFQRSICKFFGQSLAGAEVKEEFKKNFERFYENSEPKISDKFICFSNKNTIHRIKKEFKEVDKAKFGKDLKKFYGESSRESRPVSADSSYRFSLKRADIAVPI